MNQLQLCKLFAELEDVKTHMCVNIDCVENIYSDSGPYNPFIGQLQLDARDKYKVTIEYPNNYMTSELRKVAGGYTEFNSNDLISEKVIECILKSEGKQ